MVYILNYHIQEKVSTSIALGIECPVINNVAFLPWAWTWQFPLKHC